MKYLKDLKEIKSLSVKSLSNGNMTIEIKYRKSVPGIMGRMAIAKEIEELLKRSLI